MVRAFGLYWGDIRFESLSTHHCWSLSKFFIPSLVVWSITKNNAVGGEKQNKKSNGEQSDLCDLEQVTLKPQLQVHHCLTIWLQIWYHSLLWGDSIRTGADLEKQNCLFGVHPAELGKLTFSLLPTATFLPKTVFCVVNICVPVASFLLRRCVDINGVFHCTLIGCDDVIDDAVVSLSFDTTEEEVHT